MFPVPKTKQTPRPPRTTWVPSPDRRPCRTRAQRALGPGTGARPGDVTTHVLNLRVSATHRVALPRKEVIQPQLPLRLPCYDFVPITSPTLGGCPRERLAHRLQVLPAFMT